MRALHHFPWWIFQRITPLHMSVCHPIHSLPFSLFINPWFIPAFVAEWLNIPLACPFQLFSICNCSRDVLITTPTWRLWRLVLLLQFHYWFLMYSLTSLRPAALICAHGLFSCIHLWHPSTKPHCTTPRLWLTQCTINFTAAFSLLLHPEGAKGPYVVF